MNKYEKKNTHSLEDASKKAFLSVVPSKLKFTFHSENLEVQKKIVEITNYFSKPCPIQLLPLETHYFRIGNASQRKWLSPGSVFKINIFFIPDEYRDYNDVLRIRYFDEQLMRINIFAKIVTTFSFPTTVNFGNVPLGRAVCYEIPIHAHTKKEFCFAILPSKEDTCVDIYPRWGNIKPGQEPLKIMVIYRPLRYISMNFKIRIFIPDLCKTPYVINFYAYTRPSLLRETLENITSEAKNKKQRKNYGTEPRRKIKLIPLKKNILTPHTRESIAKCTTFEKITLQCDHLPLYLMHTANCILNSKIRKSFGQHELNGPLGTHLFQIMKQKVQKEKEFLIKVENRRRENVQAKFHHKPKVNYGADNINENQIIEIKMQREQAWDDYKYLAISSSEEELFEQQKVEKAKQRVLRNSRKYPNTISTTSSRKEESFLHYCKIAPFLQTVRKIVLKNRLLRVLEKLRKLIPESIDEFEVCD